MFENDLDLLSHMYEGVYVVDMNRKIVFWNKGSELITGYSAKEVVKKSCFNNILRHVTEDGKELCFDGCPLHDTLATGNINEAAVYLHHKDGHRVPVTVKSIPLYEGEKVVAAIEVFTENSPTNRETLVENRELRELLITDELTQIPNRRYLDFHLRNMKKEKEEFGVMFGILFFDIDLFKNINDTYGHNTGDEILKMVSKTLSSNLRNVDKIGRWGGEEFIAVLQVSKELSLEKIANKLRILVSKSSYETDDGISISVNVSVGGSIIKENETIEQLIERADNNMYASKKTGRNKVTIS